MLVYVGMEGDKADERGAKLKALKTIFNEPADARALNMLSGTDLATTNQNRGKNLVVNSHGNDNTFADKSAKQFYADLVAKGFSAQSFEKIYLIACSVGVQAQDNSIVRNFARDLFTIFQQNGVTAKIYAPRGVVTYKVHTENKLGQSFYVVDSIVVATKEREYPLMEGLLLQTV